MFKEDMTRLSNLLILTWQGVTDWAASKNNLPG